MDLGRVAIVHDYLSQCGGAERVVLELADLFPDAPIFTSFHDPDRTFPEFASRTVVTSSLQGRVRPDRFRTSVLRYPEAFRSFDLGSYDTVVVSSSAFAHHVVHERAFVYCHTPPRFLYAPSSYEGALGVAARLARPATSWLRHADRAAALRHRGYAANSAATAARLRRCYGLDAPIIHPPLRTDHLPSQLPAPSEARALVVSRLLPYKRVDVAVRACQLAGVPLTVVGEGPLRTELERVGAPGATFLGRVDDRELSTLFERHSVVLVPGQEDFGYGPVEASYAGRPVVAFGGGGALETVAPGTTGLLVGTHDVAAWAEAIRRAHEIEWDPAVLRAETGPFQSGRFRSELFDWLAGEDAPRPDREVADSTSR